MAGAAVGSIIESMAGENIAVDDRKRFRRS